MNDRGGDAPPANGGEFLLQLLRQSSNSASPAPSPQWPSLQTLSQDPAVAAVGPTIPTLPLPLPHTVLPPNAQDFHYGQFHHSPPSPFALNNYFQQNPNGNPNLNPDFSAPPALFGYTSHQFNPPSNRISLGDDMRKFGSCGDNSKPSVAHQPERGLIFGSLNSGFLQNDARDVFHQSLYRENKLGSSHPEKGLGMDRRVNGLPENSIDIYGNAIGSSAMLRVNEQERSSNSNNRSKHVDNGSHRAVAHPPGFSRKIQNVRNRELAYGSSTSDRDLGEGKLNSGDLCKNDRPVNQLESPGPPNRSSLHSASPSDIEKSMMKYHGEDGEDGKEFRHGGRDDINKDHQRPEIDDLEEQFVGSLGLKSEPGEQSDISDKKKHHRDKDYRSDKRGLLTLGQRRRNLRRLTACRSDINSLNTPFLAVFKSLIPADEEKIKQKQLLTVLEKLVAKEWPDARLYLYGSCANSFGFCKSDIDVCLAMEPANVDKSEVLLKLADILQSDNLQNVQALTRARVPIVKLMDPVTGISCDICVNNMLAVVNTKLLRDYAQIDVRLQQLAFIVKHWAKSRAVNETYQGTLSSYAYVLMCIHFLQQRRPAILPCLQGMETTYFATVDNVDCGFFDQVEKLHNFGSRNKENIAQLVWAFFHYWAYIHDYAKDVISVRTGGTLSKQSKDWTRRIGNDRHLVCIEDPFETSHDLGRVVDKYSIRVLREEFERAAEIMQYDRNPCVTLFEPYIPE